MGYKWKKTRTRGVRYREHPKRKQENGRPDRYYSIRYTLDGKQVEEGVGWVKLDGITETFANEQLGKIQTAIRTGNGPKSLRECREIERRERAQGMTFATFFENHYHPHEEAKARRGEKAASSVENERGLFNSWLRPNIGALPLPEIADVQIRKIKAAIAEGGRSDRTAQYCLAVVRQVFNFAIAEHGFAGVNPVKKGRATLKRDNHRQAVLDVPKARKLLAALEAKDQTLHDMTAMSLFSGMRAGEIFALTWRAVDLDAGTITVTRTKSGRDRTVPISSMLLPILERRKQSRETILANSKGITEDSKERTMARRQSIARGQQLVFPLKYGRAPSEKDEQGKPRPIEHLRDWQHKKIPHDFPRTVKALGLNKGATDRQWLACFHTLRHTFASWLVGRAGVPLYVVGAILGHKAQGMTARYSHVDEHAMRDAMRAFDEWWSSATTENVIPLDEKRKTKA